MDENTNEAMVNMQDLFGEVHERLRFMAFMRILSREKQVAILDYAQAQIEGAREHLELIPILIGPDHDEAVYINDHVVMRESFCEFGNGFDELGRGDVGVVKEGSRDQEDYVMVHINGALTLIPAGLLISFDRHVKERETNNG